MPLFLSTRFICLTSITFTRTLTGILNINIISTQQISFLWSETFHLQSSLSQYIYLVAQTTDLGVDLDFPSSLTLHSNCIKSLVGMISKILCRNYPLFPFWHLYQQNTQHMINRCSVNTYRSTQNYKQEPEKAFTM